MEFLKKIIQNMNNLLIINLIALFNAYLITRILFLSIGFSQNYQLETEAENIFSIQSIISRTHFQKMLSIKQLPTTKLLTISLSNVCHMARSSALRKLLINDLFLEPNRLYVFFSHRFRPEMNKTLPLIITSRVTKAS